MNIHHLNSANCDIIQLNLNQKQWIICYGNDFLATLLTLFKILNFSLCQFDYTYRYFDRYCYPQLITAYSKPYENYLIMLRISDYCLDLPHGLQSIWIMCSMGLGKYIATTQSTSCHFKWWLLLFHLLSTTIDFDSIFDWTCKYISIVTRFLVNHFEWWWLFLHLFDRLLLIKKSGYDILYLIDKYAIKVVMAILYDILFVILTYSIIL